MARTDDERHDLMAQLQNIFYDDAPYHMLYYDDTLVVHRTDRFAGWVNQPANGTPLFEYGSIGCTLLTVASAAPSATPVGSVAPGESPNVSPGLLPGKATSEGNTTLIIGVGAVLGLIVVGLLRGSHPAALV